MTRMVLDALDEAKLLVAGRGPEVKGHRRQRVALCAPIVVDHHHVGLPAKRWVREHHLEVFAGDDGKSRQCASVDLQRRQSWARHYAGIGHRAQAVHHPGPPSSWRNRSSTTTGCGARTSQPTGGCPRDEITGIAEGPLSAADRQLETMTGAHRRLYASGTVAKTASEAANEPC